MFILSGCQGNGKVNSTEFVYHWESEALGALDQAVALFLNLDVNNDFVIDEHTDMPHIFTFFDRDRKQFTVTYNTQKGLRM